MRSLRTLKATLLVKGPSYIIIKSKDTLQIKRQFSTLFFLMTSFAFVCLKIPKSSMVFFMFTT